MWNFAYMCASLCINISNFQIWKRACEFVRGCLLKMSLFKVYSLLFVNVYICFLFFSFYKLCIFRRFIFILAHARHLDIQGKVHPGDLTTRHALSQQLLSRKSPMIFWRPLSFQTPSTTWSEGFLPMWLHFLNCNPLFWALPLVSYRKSCGCHFIWQFTQQRPQLLVKWWSSETLNQSGHIGVNHYRSCD